MTKDELIAAMAGLRGDSEINIQINGTELCGIETVKVTGDRHDGMVELIPCRRLDIVELEDFPSRVGLEQKLAREAQFAKKAAV